jgi:hypothetical protein
MTDSNEQIHAAQWLFDVIERGGLERVSRRFYRRSSLTRGLGFRAESDGVELCRDRAGLLHREEED